MDNLIPYESIRILSSQEEDDLIDIDFQQLDKFLSTKEFQKFFFLFTIFLLFSFFPSEKCMAAVVEVLEKTNDLKQTKKSFFDGERLIQKLYQEFDFRPKKTIQSKKIIQTINQISSNIPVPNIPVSSTIPVNIEFSSPLIDLTPILNNIFNLNSKQNTPFFVEKIGLNTVTNRVNNRILFIRGGIAGYVIGKAGEKIGRKILEWIDQKTDESPSKKKDGGSEGTSENSFKNQVFTFFTANPVIAIGMVGWLYVNRFNNKEKLKDLAHTALPPSIATTLVGEKRSIKNILLKIISFKEPYLYMICGLVFVITYRETIKRLFRREITSSEAIQNITQSFVNSNLEMFNKVNELVKDFTISLVRTEKRSYDDSQNAIKNNNKTLEKTIEQLQSEKFQTQEMLEKKASSLNKCEAMFSVQNSQAIDLIEDMAQIQTYKELEYEVKKNLPKTDDKFLLTGNQLVETNINYKKRWNEIYQVVVEEMKDKFERKLKTTSFSSDLLDFKKDDKKKN